MEELWRGVPKFPQLKDLSLEDKPIFDEAFKQYPPLISEFTFTNLFMWRHTYQIKMSRLQNFLCLFADKGEASFFLPYTWRGRYGRMLSGAGTIS